MAFLYWKKLQKKFKCELCDLYYILWGNSKFVVPETLTIDWGEAEVNGQGRGDNKLAIPEYSL